MGLLDIINGMQNGPRGQHPPSGTGAKASAGGGMSPIMMALLGLVAYKAVKSFGGAQPASPGGSGRPDSLSSRWYGTGRASRWRRAGRSPRRLARRTAWRHQARGQLEVTRSRADWAACWAAPPPAAC